MCRVGETWHLHWNHWQHLCWLMHFYLEQCSLLSERIRSVDREIIRIKPEKNMRKKKRATNPLRAQGNGLLVSYFSTSVLMLRHSVCCTLHSLRKLWNILHILYFPPLLMPLLPSHRKYSNYLNISCCRTQQYSAICVDTLGKRILILLLESQIIHGVQITNWWRAQSVVKALTFS